MPSTCPITCSVRPSTTCTSTCPKGSSRAPNFDVVRRTPFATARTRPCRRVNSVMIRSDSPSFCPRSTTASSRYSLARNPVTARLCPAGPTTLSLPGRSRPIVLELPVPQPPDLLGDLVPGPTLHVLHGLPQEPLHRGG